MLTRDPELADRIRCIANHGQSVKYKHIRVGCNSRLDTLQATVLQVKLKHLDDFTHSRQVVARRYDEAFSEVSELKIPVRSPFSTHVFHQYTLRVSLDVREELQRYLKKAGIPSMIYYPLPLHWQPAYKDLCRCPLPLPVSEALCKEVLSLPIHTELDKQQPHIINTILSWINRSDLR